MKPRTARAAKKPPTRFYLTGNRHDLKRKRKMLGNKRMVASTATTRRRLGRLCRKVAGMQGRGMAVYFINPHVGWNGSLQVRKEAAEDVKQPSLRLVEPAQPA